MTRGYVATCWINGGRAFYTIDGGWSHDGIKARVYQSRVAAFGRALTVAGGEVRLAWE